MIKPMKNIKKQLNKHTCVMCNTEFEYKVNLETSTVSICANPSCPNYALLAMPLEKMMEAIDTDSIGIDNEEKEK